MSENLLRPQSDPRRILGRQGQGLVETIGVQRLCAPQNRGERLQRDAGDVVLRLLGGERDARRLRVEAHPGGARVLRAEALRHYPIPDLACGAILRNLLEEIVMRVEEEAEPRGEIVDGQATPQRPLDVLDAVIKRESQLLQRGRSCFANVVAGNRNGIEARRMARPKLDCVDDQAHRRSRRIQILLLCDVFLQNVVLQSARKQLPVRALALSDDQVHRPQHAGGRVDGHRDGSAVERNAGEQRLHVLDRVDGHATLAHLAFALCIVRVAAHERGQIERDGKSAGSAGEEVLVPEICFFRRGKAGELPHGPEASAITGGMNPARIGRLSRQSQIFALVLVPVLGQVRFGIETTNEDAGNGGETRVAGLITIHAGRRADGLLWSFRQRRFQRLPHPAGLLR